MVTEPGTPEAGSRGGLDWRLFVALRTRCHPRYLELPVIVFSTTGNWGFFWVGLAAILWLAGGSNWQFFLFLFVLVYATLVFNYAIKVALGRQRPAFDDPRLAPLVGTPSSKSFPSSHSAMSFAAACALAWLYPRYGPLFFALAIIMSWSRVYVGVHFPSDVVAGTVVGVVAGLVGVGLAVILQLT